MGNSSVKQNFFKNRIAGSVKYYYQMYTSMFEVYKNKNIIQFAQKLLCQSHLKDGDTDALNRRRQRYYLS